jgi:CRISPR-associated protein Csd1
MSALAALVRAYDRMVELNEAPGFGYSIQNIGFLISLNADGSVAGGPTDLRSGEGKKRISRRLAVPQQPVDRTSAIAPNFLWDKTAYALGVTGGEGKRTAAEHKAFITLHREMLAGSDDEGLNALLRFLEGWRPDQFIELAWSEEMKDQNVVFALEQQRLDDIYIHDRPAARELWAKLSSDGDKNAEAVCLVRGEKAPVARSHPVIKGVWGAQSSGARIVSFNLDAFTSYGHEQGDNAQVSETAAFAYTTALNRFLERDSGHRIQIGDASTVFWADGGDPKVAEEAEDFFAGLMGIDDEKIANRGVKDTLEKIRAGRAAADVIADLPKDVRFYILGLAPNASRLSIRFYLEDDFGVIARRYLEHVERLRIEPAPREAAPSMWRMLVETAVLRKTENIQPNLAGEWLRAILSGTPYPRTLLSALIMRLRADHEVNGLRVAMLKSVLVRNFDTEVPVALDPAFTDQGYLLGRLFAIYEQVQTAALGRNVNATIKDKYYGAASAQPRKVFHLLESGSANHLSKIGKQKPGLKVNMEKQIGAIMDLMEPGKDPFPASLPDKSQALFGLGYYHQRNEFFRKPEKMTPEDAAA